MGIVKTVKDVYERTCDICDAQAAVDPETFSRAYLEEVLSGHTLLWDQLILHLSDVSSPCKPFNVCKAWAARVQAEFFGQGDEEKLLAIPVGMLNDRDKVNPPSAEHGFINFLVAPLVIATVSVF